MNRYIHYPTHPFCVYMQILHISIFKFAFVASGAGGAGHAQGLRGHLAPRKHRYLPHRSRWALEMAARARSEPQERSKWLLEPARSRSGARNGRSSPPRSRWGARNRCSSPPRSRWGARNSRSSPVGVAGALEMAARAPSASLGRSKWPHEPARLRWGGRNRCSGPLGFAEALTLAARVRSASLGRSKWPLELARLRWGGRNRCSGLLSRPRWGARQRCSSFMRKSCSKTLCSGRDSLWTPGSVRLSSEHGYARVRAGWLAGWPTDWLAGWLAKQTRNQAETILMSHDSYRKASGKSTIQ